LLIWAVFREDAMPIDDPRATFGTLGQFQYLPDAPARVVSMCEHKGRLFVATEQRVYEMVDGKWHPMVFVTGDSDGD
jgi:hypothetical protein